MDGREDVSELPARPSRTEAPPWPGDGRQRPAVTSAHKRGVVKGTGMPPPGASTEVRSALGVGPTPKIFLETLPKLKRRDWLSGWELSWGRATVIRRPGEEHHA